MMQGRNGTKSILQFGEESITPQVAGSLLGTMNGNRTLRRSAVNRYARDMIGGRWRLNGEAIKISRSGRLIDGQHRLQAVIEANIPVRMHVLRGVEDQDIVTLDTGVGRTYHDAGMIRGEASHRLAGPVARWWYKYEQGSPTVGFTPTHQELDDIIARHSSIPASAAFVNKLKIVRTRCRSSVQGFVHSYVTEMWDGDVADLFMLTLNDGTGLKPGDPVLALRSRLVDEDTKGSLRPHYVLAITIKAWEAWVDGRTVRQLRWTTGGPTPEPFPRFSRDVVPVSSSPERKRELARIHTQNLAKTRNHRREPAGRN